MISFAEEHKPSIRERMGTFYNWISENFPDFQNQIVDYFEARLSILEIEKIMEDLDSQEDTPENKRKIAQHHNMLAEVQGTLKYLESEIESTPELSETLKQCQQKFHEEYGV